MRTFLLSALVLAGCTSKWNTLDLDGDGVTVAEGDCFEGEGGETTFPGAVDSPYDGVDQDCSGGSDFDADQDGHDAAEFGGDDCWDLPGSYPDGFVAVAGATQLEPGEVYPGTIEIWYDGIDGDCSGGSDFDQDGDGADSSAAPQVDGGVGDDCYDAVDPSCDTYDDADVDCTYPRQGELVGDPFDPADIHPGAADSPYDGTNQDCDSACDDYDQDCDGYVITDECDDTDPATYPDDSVPEVWGNCVDENCDGNFADQDLDGWLAAGVEKTCPDALDEVDLRYLGDCWDDPTDATGWDAANGLPDPEAGDVHPEAYDPPYDGLDEDCAGGDDYDADGDGYRTGEYPDETGAFGADCDDARGDIHPGAVDAWYDGEDSDCAGNDDYDQDYDGHTDPSDPSGLGDDCDDTDGAVNPDMEELCSTAVDDDCTGSANDDQAVGCAIFYSDVDGDRHAGTTSQCLCEAEGAYTYTTTDDCNDGDAEIYPGHAEECGTYRVDDDCDGQYNETGANDCVTRYVDTDGDGHGTAVSECRCEAVGTYTATVGDDCSDSDATAYPGAAEACDDVDDDCDGVADDGLTVYYTDSDRDGHGRSGSTGDCSITSGVTNSDDCNDSDNTVYTGATEQCDDVDDDCDGSVDEGLTTYYIDTDRDGHGLRGSTADCSYTTGSSVADDCNDSDNTVYTGATEQCDDVDDDCDGSIDEGLTTKYIDSDGDGHGRSGSTADCSYTTGSSVADDCNDSDNTVYTGATETCDSVDDDCDGSVDEGLPTTYTDSDRDGYGSGGAGCTTGTGRANNNTDCDDARSGVNPGATELCSTTYDDDCNDGANEVGASGCTTRYYDFDNDDYGTAVSQCACADDGYYRGTATGDCNDSSSSVYPGATETCNSIDDDCDSSTDEGVQNYADTDGDGQGAGSATCSSGAGYVSNSTDCDDTDARVYVGATELCDGQYNNCTGSGSWTAASENNKVSVVNGGTWSNLTVSTSSGTVTTVSVAGNYDYYVCPGTYYVRFSNTGTRNMNIYGSGAGSVTLNGGASGAVVSITNGGTSTLSGVTITNGSGTSVSSTTYGGGVYVNYGSAPVSPNLAISDCVLDGNAADNGGNLAARGSAWVTVTDSEITNGSATNGGGLAMVGDGKIDLTNVTVSGNSATDLGGGGYITNGDGEINLLGSLLFGNDAGATGGGVHLATGDLTCSSAGGVYDNLAGTIGGGVYVEATSNASITSTSCDWGAGGTDNLCSDTAPCGDDIAMRTNGSNFNPYAAYGASATFSCTGYNSGGGGSGGTCSP